MKEKMEARIVIIVNHQSMRDLLTLSLKRKGWQVFDYAYDQINLMVLEEHAPDLIILDFNGLNAGLGWEFLQILKMRDITAEIPILITLSDCHLSAEVQDYLLTRYINVVHKPFDTLIALVQKTLTQASQRRAIYSDDRTLPILVVDDNDELRDSTTLVLRMEGYRVVTAYNGLVALDTVSRADYTLILLDIVMPVMNGYEFLKAYQQQFRPHTPVIIVSAERDILTRVLPSFVVEVLPKPFSVHQLLGMVGMYAQPI
jgi:DNA-binding response OmpR family regulator